MEDLLSVTPDFMSDGEKVRYNKWSRRFQTAAPGSDSYRTAERMLKTFRTTAEATHFGTTLDTFKLWVVDEVKSRSRSMGTWNADMAGESSSLNIRVSQPNGASARQVRVIMWPDKPDRMYFKMSGSNVQYMIPLKGTGLKYSRTTKSLVPAERLDRIKSQAASAGWISENEVADILHSRGRKIMEEVTGIDMYSQAKRHPYHSTTDHIHMGPMSASMSFKLDETTRKNLDLAFQGVSQSITQTSHENVAEREVKRMIGNATHGRGNPDDMEAAALRLATLAQEIRTFDELEPEGDEPVITWKHSFSDGDTVYTYVAVKLGERWYVTGSHQAGRTFVWRDFLDQEWAKPLAAGDFLLVTEWTQVGGQ